MTEKQNRFDSIDVLRGFAAVSVVVYHVIEHYHWDAFPRTGPLLWFRIGGMGVDLFFVISGFVISLTAFDGIDRLGPRSFRAPFATHRLKRIVPLYLLTAVLYVALVRPEMVGNADFARQALTHLFFVHNLDPATNGGIDGPNWSVGTEMQFYLLILLAAPILRSLPGWFIAYTFIVLAIIWRALVFRFVPFDATTGPYPIFVYAGQLPGSLDHFGVGILLAHVVRSQRGQALLERLQAYPLITVVPAALAVWAALSLYWLDAEYWHDKWMVVFFRISLAISFGVVIFSACCFTGPITMRLTAPLRYLGTISYGIYLWHLLVLETVQKFTEIDIPTAFAIILGGTLLLAAASWHFFERPIMQWRKSTTPFAAVPMFAAGCAAAATIVAIFAISAAMSPYIDLRLKTETVGTR